MPVLAIPFPAFDPVLVADRPVRDPLVRARLYRRILLGWLLCARLVRNERAVGRAAADDRADFDDFVIWVTLGVILGGRIGYVLFYNPAHFAAIPLEIFAVWKGGMSFHGGFARRACWRSCCSRAGAGIPILVAQRRDLRGGADRTVPRPARQFHQRRALGPA